MSDNNSTEKNEDGMDNKTDKNNSKEASKDPTTITYSDKLKDYELIKVISNGEFSSVNLVMHKPTQTKVVLKIAQDNPEPCTSSDTSLSEVNVNLSQIYTSDIHVSYDNNECLKQEGSLLEKLHYHKNIVKCYKTHFDEEKQKVFLVLEHVGNGNLSATYSLLS
eukprot:Pgem_evm1s2311